MSPDTERAWAAGFYDGEGSTSLFGNAAKPRCYVRCYIGQDGRQLADLQRFQSAVGVGSIRREGHRKGTTDLGYFHWSAQSMADVAVAQNILFPYLGEHKREQWLRAEEEARRNRLMLGTAP